MHTQTPLVQYKRHFKKQCKCKNPVQGRVKCSPWVSWLLQRGGRCSPRGGPGTSKGRAGGAPMAHPGRSGSVGLKRNFCTWHGHAGHGAFTHTREGAGAAANRRFCRAGSEPSPRLRLHRTCSAVKGAAPPRAAPQTHLGNAGYGSARNLGPGVLCKPEAALPSVPRRHTSCGAAPAIPSGVCCRCSEESISATMVRQAGQEY